MDINNPLSQSIAKQLYQRIKGEGMQMQRISERTDIGLGSLSRYVNGKRDIPAPLFAIICNEIGLDPGEVLRNAIEEFTGANAEGD